MKSNLKFISLLLAVLIVFGGLWFKISYLDKPTLITVTGEGSVKVKPTVAKFTVTVANLESSSALALADNVRLTKDLMNLAKTAGAKDNDIVVSYARVVPVAASGGKTQWQASNAISVTLRNLSTFDNLVASLYATGATSVGNIVFTTENSGELEKQAIEQAVQDANTRAKELAKSLGKRVGRMTSVATGEVGEAGALAGQAQTAKATGEVISSPSQIEITRQASIVFEFR